MYYWNSVTNKVTAVGDPKPNDEDTSKAVIRSSSPLASVTDPWTPVIDKQTVHKTQNELHTYFTLVFFIYIGIDILLEQID